MSSLSSLRLAIMGNWKIYLRFFKESVSMAFQSMVNDKLRTALSLLGVTIGIFSIISVLTMVDSMEEGLRESFAVVNDNVIFVQKWPFGPEEGDDEFQWWKYMKRRQPTLKDLNELQSRDIPGVRAMAFSTSIFKTAQYRNSSMSNAAVISITEDYREAVNMNVENGRFLTNPEFASGQNSVVIGHEVAEQLFADENPVGKRIKVAGLKVEVVGVLEKEGSSLFGNGLDQAVVVNAKFGSKIIDYKSVDCNLLVKTKEGFEMDEVKRSLVREYRQVRRLRRGEDNDFSVIKSDMFSAIIGAIFGVVSTVGWLVGGLSILVGGFSIANIMFVSVKERTNIIGIQKALGSRRSFIMAQFITESVTLCFIGGLVGLVVIFILVLITRATTEFPMTLSTGNVALGVGISILIGMLSGLVPAWKASRLDPVEAIRG